MSDEHVRIVQAALVALGRDGLDAFIDRMTDDVDHRSIEGAPDDHGPLHGKDAVRAYLQDWVDTFDDVDLQPVELVDAGENAVVAVLRLTGRAKLSGVPTEQTYAVVYTIRDRKIAAGREYATRAEAFEAAGESRQARA
jgi:ketosteroid isomerase-like protein